MQLACVQHLCTLISTICGFICTYETHEVVDIQYFLGTVRERDFPMAHSSHKVIIICNSCLEGAGSGLRNRMA